MSYFELLRIKINEINNEILKDNFISYFYRYEIESEK